MKKEDILTIPRLFDNQGAKKSSFNKNPKFFVNGIARVLPTYTLSKLK